MRRVRFVAAASAPVAPLRDAVVYLPLMPADRMQVEGNWSTKNHGTLGGYALLGDGTTNVPEQCYYVEGLKGVRPAASNTSSTIALPAVWLDVTGSFTVMIRASHRCDSTVSPLLCAFGILTGGAAKVCFGAGSSPGKFSLNNGADTTGSVYSYHPAVWILRADTSTVQLYRDGVLLASAAKTSGSVAGSYHYIGGSGTVGSSTIATHDVAAWRRQLTDAEIAQLVAYYLPNNTARTPTHCLSGQSNMSGPVAASLLPAGWNNDFGVQLAFGGIDGTDYSAVKWGALRDNSGGLGSGGWGPEFTFGRASNIRGQWIAKWDHSGYGLALFLGDGTYQRRSHDTLLREVYALGCEPDYKSFVWDQGEGDMTVGAAAAAYGANLTRLILEFRSATKSALPFVTSTLNSALKNQPLADLYLLTLTELSNQWQAENDAKAAVVAADAHAALVNADTAGMTLLAQPQLHRDANGTEVAGAAYAAAVASLS